MDQGSNPSDPFALGALKRCHPRLGQSTVLGRASDGGFPLLPLSRNTDFLTKTSMKLGMIQKALKWSSGFCSHHPIHKGHSDFKPRFETILRYHFVCWIFLYILFQIHSLFCFASVYLVLFILANIPEKQSLYVKLGSKAQSHSDSICRSGDRCSLYVCDAIREMCSPNEADLVLQPLLSFIETARDRQGSCDLHLYKICFQTLYLASSTQINE